MKIRRRTIVKAVWTVIVVMVLFSMLAFTVSIGA